LLILKKKTKSIYLFQPQYGTSIGKFYAYYLPYSVGCLWSYVQQFPNIIEHFNLKDFIFYRENPDDLLARMEQPAVCGFSCYSWNENYCMHVAERIKKNVA
jgi:hypothetical protein